MQLDDLQRSGTGRQSSATERGSDASPGKTTLVEQLNVQRQPRGPGLGPTTDDVHAAAAQGVAGESGPLPHLDVIQRAFGHHDVRGIAAHVGGAAESASRAIGAEAYATGNSVAFAGPPSLHTAAHEAAHVIQQRSGRVQLANGVGAAGDSHEQLADQVADAVVQGRSAEALLDRMTGAPPAAAASAGPVATAPAGGQVQRQVENAKYDTSKDKAKDAAAAKLFFESYDQAVGKAYQFAVTVPSLGAYAELNGYTKLWGQKWQEHLSGGAPKLMAAAFGYVIESLVSESRSEYCPKAPGSYSVATQVPSGGTRPDLVLSMSREGAQVAWLDLTAANSADHIFSKDGWDKKIANFAEVTYPSLDLATMALMKQNKDNKGALSKEEFAERVKAASAEHAKKKAAWRAFGQQFTVANMRGALKDKGLTKEAIGLSPELGQNFIRGQLEDKLGTKIDNKLVPSILVAMGLSAAPWGYLTGTSQSEKAGEAWLIDNCPIADGTKSDGDSMDTSVD
jgi:hypothetical protein